MDSIKGFVTVALLAMAVYGCATQPEELAAQSVSPLQYQSYTCGQIAAEMARTSRRINELYATLKKTADNDQAQMAVGMILLWPTLFWLEGGDGPQAVEYSRLKGEYEALETVSIQKSCSVPASSKVTRWATQATEAVAKECKDATSAELIAASGNREDYKVPCGVVDAKIVRCESGACQVL